MVEKNNNKHITCPHCSKDVNIEQAIIDTYVSKEMTKFKKENETTLRKKIEKEYSDELLEKDHELENYSKKLVDQNRMKSRIKSLLALNSSTIYSILSGFSFRAVITALCAIQLAPLVT